MTTRRPRRRRRLGTAAHPGGRYPWWLLHHARRHIYLDGATPDPDDDDSPLDDEFDDAPPSEAPAMTTYHGDEQPDGSIVVACWTNDNRDTGYPGEEAAWTLTHASRQAARRIHGASRVGWGGTHVTVTVNGRRIERPEEWDQRDNDTHDTRPGAYYDEQR